VLDQGEVFMIHQLRRDGLTIRAIAQRTLRAMIAEKVANGYFRLEVVDAHLPEI